MVIFFYILFISFFSPVFLSVYISPLLLFSLLLAYVCIVFHCLFTFTSVQIPVILLFPIPFRSFFSCSLLLLLLLLLLFLLLLLLSHHTQLTCNSLNPTSPSLIPTGGIPRQPLFQLSHKTSRCLRPPSNLPPALPPAQRPRGDQRGVYICTRLPQQVRRVQDSMLAWELRGRRATPRLMPLW